MKRLSRTDRQAAAVVPRWDDRYVKRTYSGRPSSSMRFSAATAIAISVVRHRSVRERSPSRKQAAHFDSDRQIIVLIKSCLDHGGFGDADGEHAGSMRLLAEARNYLPCARRSTRYQQLLGSMDSAPAANVAFRCFPCGRTSGSQRSHRDTRLPRTANRRRALRLVAPQRKPPRRRALG